MKHITRILTLLLALTFLFSLAACSEESPDVPSGFLLAENEGADYYFYYPSTWLLNRSDAGMTSAFVSDTDFSNVSVTVFTSTGQYATLQEYAEEYYFKHFEGNFQNLSVERNQDGSLKRENLKIDDCDAMSVAYTAEFSGEEYSFRNWFISYNGYIYSVLYTAKSGLYEIHLAEAQAIATNLKFK